MERVKIKTNENKWKAEFNMAVADLERLSFILQRIDEVAPMVRAGQLDITIHYYSLLYQFYAQMDRFIINKDDWKAKFLMIENILDGKPIVVRRIKGKHRVKKYVTIQTWLLPKMLDDLYLELNDIRQILGLGIPVKHNFKGIKKGVQ